jgi:autotransporter-associated beta strand protein
MQLGQAGNAGVNALGVLTLDNGVVDVNNATNGNQEVSGGGTGVGVINLNTNASLATNATLLVNGTLTLAASTGIVTPGTAGTINISGGALAAGTIVNGGGQATINVTNGSFTLTGTGGTAASPLSALSTVNSTLTLGFLRNGTNIVVISLSTGGPTNRISITSVSPSPSYPVQVHLIKYSSSIGGAGFNFGVGSLPPLCAGFISNNVAAGSVDLVLTSGPLTDTWTGIHSGDWDTTTANWQAGGPVTYVNGAFVQFLDGASTGNINLTTSLLPGGVTVSNNALAYTFNGTGKLSGFTSLVKQGAGVLVLDNSGSNDFSGGVTIGAGTLQIGNNDTSGNVPTGSVTDNGALVVARTDNTTLSSAISGTGSLTQAGAGSTLLVNGANTFTGPVLVTNGSVLQLGGSSALGSGGSVVVANGSTLDANGYSATKSVRLSGTGVGGNGALIGSVTIYDNPGPGVATNIVLTGDTTFGFPTRWDLGSGNGGSTLGTDGSAHNLTLMTFNGYGSGYFEWRNLTVLPPLANIDIASGNLGVVGTTTFGDPNATLTIAPSAALTLWGANVYVNKGVDFQAGGTINNASGANIMNGAMTLEPGFCTFVVNGNTTLTLSNVLSGSGVFYLNGSTGTTVLWGNSPSFTGGVSLYTGQLTLNGSIGSGIISQAGTTLTGSGSASGLVDVSGAMSPGGFGTTGTFTAGGGLTLESSATLTMDLGTTTGGANDLIAVTGNLTVNGNNISINPLAGTLANGSYTLFTYTGSLTGSFGTASTVAASRYTFTIDTSTPHVVKLNVVGVPNLLVWNNGANNGQWDVQSSLNWTNLTTHAEDQFFTADTVLLDNTITTAANPTTTLNIPAGQVVVPSVLTNNSSTNYTITGAGKISGAASVVKLGSSSLTIGTTNDFTGNFTIGGGSVQIDGQLSASASPVGAANGTLTVSNAATLIVNLQGGYPNGNIGFSTKPLVVSGAGANGQGAIQNNGNPIYNDSSTLAGLGQNVTLAGNTTIGGSNRWDWGYPGLGATLSTRGSNFNFTIIEPSYSQWGDLIIDTNLGNIDFYSTASSQQTWRVSGMGGSLGNPTNTLTLRTNVLMNIQHGGTTAGDNGYAKIIHVLSTCAFQYQPSGGAGDYRLRSSFIMESNTSLSFFSVDGGSGSGVAISGTVVLNGLVHFQTGNGPITFSNVISGPGGFYWDNYDNNLIFLATNTYQGITDIRSGRTLALAGNGSILGSTNISLAASATLDVSARTDHTLTLAAGQTLQGQGIVNGNLAVGAGAVVSPGGANAIGVLTVTNVVTLSGTAIMELNKTAGTFDQISGASSITYGGTLSLTNLSGTLAVNDSFKLFNAGSYAGSFGSITPATPGPGLAWDTSGLGNGTIRVAGPPTISKITVSGGKVIISGQFGPGAGGTYSVFTATNLSSPNWVLSNTGTFDSNGNFSSTNAVGTHPQQFYKLRVP